MLLNILLSHSRSLTSLEIAPLDRPHTSSCWRYVVTMALSCIVSEIKRYIGGKSPFFHTPLHSTPALGGPRRNIAITFGMYGKLEWCDYPMVESSMTRSAVSTQYRRVTYRQTDRRTSCHGVVGACAEHRAVNTCCRSLVGAGAEDDNENNCRRQGFIQTFSPVGISVVSGGGCVRWKDLNLSAILMYIVSMISSI